MCMYKTRMFSVKLNVCVCVSMSELKEDTLVCKYKPMCMYMCVCPGMYEFSATFLTVVYISGSSGVTLSCRDVPVCWFVGLSALNKETSLFILFGKIKVDQRKIFLL